MRQSERDVVETAVSVPAAAAAGAARAARDGENRQRERPKNWEGQKLGGAKTGRGNSTENLAPPKKNQTSAPPKKREKSGQWIEFKPGTKRKDGTRLYYPKWRKWKSGNKKKEWLGPVLDLEPMTKQEKENYVKQQRAAKKRRQQRRGRD